MPTSPLTLCLILSTFLASIGQGAQATFRVHMSPTHGPYTADQIKQEIARHWDVARRCIAESDAVRQHHAFKGWTRYSMTIDPNGKVGSARIEDGYLSGFDVCFKEKVLYKLVFPPVAERAATLTGFTLHANE